MSNIYEQYWQVRGKSGFRPRYKVFYDWIESGSSVLDIGCGDGYFGEVLQKKKNVTYTGIDISESALNIARGRGLNVRLCDASDSSQLSLFADGQFDYVLMSEFIEHIPNSEEVLIQATRIAKKGILVSVPNIAYWKHRFELITGTFPRQWVYEPNEHLRFWSISDFFKTAEKIGLQVFKFKASNGKRYLRDFWPNLFGFQICFYLRKFHTRPNIFFASYSYIFPHNYKLFDFFKNKKSLKIIIPRIWRSTKGNKMPVCAWNNNQFDIIPTPTYFYHSKYPIIKGMLKGWMPLLPLILGKYARKGDIVFSAYEPNLLSTAFCALVCKLVGLKHIFFTWQNVPYGMRLSGAKYRVTLKIMDFVFRNSSGALFGMNRALAVHADWISRFPNIKSAVIPQTGIDVDVFKPTSYDNLRLKLGISKSDRVVLYASTFTPRKGTMEALDAFGAIATKHKDVKFIVIGTGDLRTEVESRISKPDLVDRVILLPWQKLEDLPAFYSMADVLVHPSMPFEGWEEQFGLLILQAQSCGTPVIATKSGSLEESVLDGKTGILVQVGDVNNIIVAIDKIISDNDFRIMLGNNAREYITDHFSFKSVADRLEKFFENL